MKKLVFISILFATGQLTAQQLPLFSSFDQNLYLVNPGMTGYGRFSFFSLGGKKQWVGFENSPFTQNFSGHSSINEKNYGFGGSFTSDTRGILKTNQVALSLGYHAKMGKEAKLGFGVTGNFSAYSLDQSAMNLYDPDDALLLANMRSGFVPNISAGIALHREDYAFGISALNILSSKINFRETHRNAEATHYFFHGKYRIQLNKIFGFTPSLLASYVQGYPVYGDAQVNFHLFNRFDILAGGRTNMDFHMGAGMEIIQDLRLYYYYDMVLSGLKPGNGGSHEIFICYTWYYSPYYKGDKARYRWIRKGRSKPDKVEKTK